MQSGGGQAPSLNASQIGNDQTKANVNSAVSTARLNATNQVTPFGSLNYNETGGQSDSNGNWIPQFTATTSLSPQVQSLVDQTQGIQGQALSTASGLFGNLNSVLSKPIDLSGLPPLPGDQSAFRNDAYNALTARGQADIDRSRTADRTALANQGIQPGSTAWDRDMDQFGRQATDLSNQSFINAGTLAGQNQDQALQARNQGLSELLLQRTQPLQELSSLFGLGSGIQMPTFQNTPQTQVQAADVTSPQLAAFNAQNQDYMQAQANATSSNNALIGGIAGLGGMALGGALGGPLGAGVPGMFGLGGKSGGIPTPTMNFASIGGLPRSAYQ